MMAVKTLGDLAQLVQGAVIGDARMVITDALPLQDARPGCITLLDNERHAEKLERSGASAAVVPHDFRAARCALIAVAEPHQAFEQMVRHLRPEIVHDAAGVHPAAHVHASARLGRGVVVHPQASIAEDCVIGANTVVHSGVRIGPGCHIGADCELFPNVTLYERTRIGNRVVIHAGAILGAYGFGYRLQGAKHCRTAQLGWVEVGDDVELGAGTTVDRGTFGATIIGEGSKLDNQVMIGHNCHIGKHNLLCAQVGIAGSATTGDYVVMGGKVGIKDHLRIGNKVVIAAQAGVMHNIPDGEVWQGSPAVPQRESMQQIALTRRLPDMRHQLRELEQCVSHLRAQLAAIESADASAAERTGDQSDHRAA
jgi:UDP-3-O-[3-hydroxymyristoyl] glucosamine N-acyltransferase